MTLKWIKVWVYANYNLIIITKFFLQANDWLVQKHVFIWLLRNNQTLKKFFRNFFWRIFIHNFAFPFKTCTVSLFSFHNILLHNLYMFGFLQCFLTVVLLNTKWMTFLKWSNFFNVANGNHLHYPTLIFIFVNSYQLRWKVTNWNWY